MTWEWIVASAAVKIIFLFAPMINSATDFALADDNLREAKEYAQAAACRGMMLSLPVVFFISALAEADKTCKLGVHAVSMLIGIACVSASGFVLAKVPIRILRGTIPPYVLLIFLTAADRG